MAAGYYIHEPSSQWTLERWENEGGRLRRQNDYSLNPIGEKYLRPMEQAIPIARFGKLNEIATRCYYWLPTRAKYITGQTLIVDGEETLRESVSAV